MEKKLTSTPKTFMSHLNASPNYKTTTSQGSNSKYVSSQGHPQFQSHSHTTHTHEQNKTPDYSNTHRHAPNTRYVTHHPEEERTHSNIIHRRENQHHHQTTTHTTKHQEPTSKHTSVTRHTEDHHPTHSSVHTHTIRHADQHQNSRVYHQQAPTNFNTAGHFDSSNTKLTVNHQYMPRAQTHFESNRLRDYTPVRGSPDGRSTVREIVAETSAREVSCFGVSSDNRHNDVVRVVENPARMTNPRHALDVSPNKVETSNAGVRVVEKIVKVEVPVEKIVERVVKVEVPVEKIVERVVKVYEPSEEDKQKFTD